MTNEVEVAVPEEQPTLILKGRYALYQNADGSGHLVYTTSEDGPQEHQPIPATFWAIGLKIMSGEKINPMEILGTLMKGV